MLAGSSVINHMVDVGALEVSELVEISSEVG